MVVTRSGTTCTPTGSNDESVKKRKSNPEMPEMVETFKEWESDKQTNFVKGLLGEMCHEQHWQIDMALRPYLMRDFISALPEYVSEQILSYLDELSLCRAESVSKRWREIICNGHLWRKLIVRNVNTKAIWQRLGKRREWISHLHRASEFGSEYYKELYPKIVQDLKMSNEMWKLGKLNLRKIDCASHDSKGVYCLQYDDEKIVSGLRDNTIKVWDLDSLKNTMTLTGHTGSVLCMQYDENIIITGSSDASIRIWDVKTGEPLHMLIHHCDAVLHLRFQNGIMVSCSKDRTIAVWTMSGNPQNIVMKHALVGHRAAVNVVDFDEKYIVSASGDRTIKVWGTEACEFIRTLQGHTRGIACLQYHGTLVVSGSSDCTIKLWDIEAGAILRTLEGHEELVRCIRFDSHRIVSGAYDGKIKVWDLKAALDPRTPVKDICIRTISEHKGRVFRLQFDEFQIVSSSHDDSIVIFDFLSPHDYYGDFSACKRVHHYSETSSLELSDTTLRRLDSANSLDSLDELS
ncbi:hypothetical protein ACHWQZ_G017542 [Mnemiopsis leidyi]